MLDPTLRCPWSKRDNAFLLLSVLSMNVFDFLKIPQCHVTRSSRTEDYNLLYSDCLFKNKALTTSQLISQLHTFPNCSLWVHIKRWAFEDIIWLLDSQPQHIFWTNESKHPGTHSLFTGWCKVHLNLILKLLKLWSIQVCWHALAYVL